MLNTLPQHFRDIISYNVCKRQVNAWSGETCVCYCSDVKILLVLFFFSIIVITLLYNLHVYILYNAASSTISFYVRLNSISILDLKR